MAFRDSSDDGGVFPAEPRIRSASVRQAALLAADVPDNSSLTDSQLQLQSECAGAGLDSSGIQFARCQETLSSPHENHIEQQGGISLNLCVYRRKDITSPCRSGESRVQSRRSARPSTSEPRTTSVPLISETRAVKSGLIKRHGELAVVKCFCTCSRWGERYEQ
ncbi:hypothetical protein SKAU_G00179350 [Synaphobranchus kaupii]|uniref:Uncharacterized protein n=1 Tax=Synaphobranchus kaupii TaxID=118154 RepID=A0A9Q1J1I6_SYNKA|nr:hypothetical protein SKAU_G00179350 [Synaphobranchus kaupii]